MKTAYPKSERSPQSRCMLGVARSIVTPPVGIYHRMWGAAKHDRSTAAHRCLYATVAAFGPLKDGECGGIEQILVALDHCVMGASEHRALVETISAGCQMPVEQISVVFSHTHGAGLMSLDRVSLPGGDLIPPYLASLGAECALLAKTAIEQAVPVWGAYGVGRCNLARYRDFYDEDAGQYVVGYTPGRTVDDTLIIARFTQIGGRTVASFINYACHPTSAGWDNPYISPDFVGAAREVVEDTIRAPCIFLQGASGELGPKRGFTDVDQAERNGFILGHAAASAFHALSPPGTEFCYAGTVTSGANIGTWCDRPIFGMKLRECETWKLTRWQEPLKYREGIGTVAGVSAERDALLEAEEQARATERFDEAADLRALAERKTRLLQRLAQLPEGTHYPLKVVLWEVGQAVWIVVQGESYSMLQTTLRERFPDRILIIATIAEDWGPSYLPPRDVYGKGIYQETIAVVEAGSLEQLIESISSRINK
jgi:hypothetical protein